MSTPSFDLVDIVQTIRKRFRFIMIVTLAAALIGIVFHLLRKKEFPAKVEFFVSNPLLSDRNILYGGADSRVDYFADQDDIDRVLAFAESDTVILQVLLESNLAHEKDKDLIDPRNVYDMKKYFLEHTEIKRTEYGMLQVTFADPDPVRAARVANTIVKVLEESYRKFYNTRRNNIYNSLTKKYAEQDSAIAVLTDTLAKLRDRSGIYELISPNRDNIISASVTKGANSGKDIELIQNLSALKDGLVIDHTRLSSLISQFSTGTGQMELELFQVITTGRQPISPSGPNGILTIIIAAFIGFFFAAIYVLIATYYKAIIAVER